METKFSYVSTYEDLMKKIKYISTGARSVYTLHQYKKEKGIAFLLQDREELMIGKVEKVKGFNVVGLPFSNNINITMWSDRIRTLHWAGYIQIVRDQRLSIFSQMVLWNSSLNNHAKLSQNYFWELGWYSGNNNNNKNIYYNIYTVYMYICLFQKWGVEMWKILDLLSWKILE